MYQNCCAGAVICRSCTARLLLVGAQHSG